MKSFNDEATNKSCPNLILPLSLPEHIVPPRNLEFSPFSFSYCWENQWNSKLPGQIVNCPGRHNDSSSPPQFFLSFFFYILLFGRGGEGGGGSKYNCISPPFNNSWITSSLMKWNLWWSEAIGHETFLLDSKWRISDINTFFIYW